MTLDGPSVLSESWCLHLYYGSDNIVYGIYHTPGSCPELGWAGQGASLSSGVAAATMSSVTQGSSFYVSLPIGMDML